MKVKELANLFEKKARANPAISSLNDLSILKVIEILSTNIIDIKIRESLLEGIDGIIIALEEREIA